MTAEHRAPPVVIDRLHLCHSETKKSYEIENIDDNGRVYFAMSSATSFGSQAVVATSDNHGLTWQNVFDVGAAYKLKNVFYPAAVAADTGRAAVAFYGSTTGGDGSANSFNGIWHLYVANTFPTRAHERMHAFSFRLIYHRLRFFPVAVWRFYAKCNDICVPF